MHYTVFLSSVFKMLKVYRVSDTLKLTASVSSIMETAVRKVRPKPGQGLSHLRKMSEIKRNV